MNCWDRFDRKTMLYFTGNKDTRVPRMEMELKRVGLDDADRQWQFPSPVDRVLVSSVKHIPALESNIGYFNCTMGHYRAIATAYHLGCSSVLIMEDDIRFLKDTGEIERSVNDIPEDYDLAMLDCFYISMDDANGHVADRLRKERRKNDHWAEFDAFYSGACYALSRRGMERMLFCYEAVEKAPKIGLLRICDNFFNRKYLGKDAKMYFAVKNIGIQRGMGRSNSQGAGMSDPYGRLGIDKSEYADA